MRQLTRNDGADRVVVIGLDCASPWLLFERWRERLPAISALMERGAWGTLRSCHPPITVPAWRIMASGADAGRQGVYGFRNRVGEGYADVALTHSGMFRAPAIWDKIGECGLRTTLVGVPGTWPAAPMQGKVISGPLTPSPADSTWPGSLGSRVAQLSDGAYLFDIENHRTVPPEALVEQVREMTVARARVVEALARDDDWNLLFFVEIGLDRLHHALWHHVDPRHPRYVPDSALDTALLEYCQLLDEGVGRLVEICDDGETAFALVSDHGARPMEGGIHVNDWLISEGYLHLKTPTDGPTAFDPVLVDWDRTRAWAVGGYCARVYLNLAGRQPRGVVERGDAQELLLELKEGFEAICAPGGRSLDTRAWTAEELYPGGCLGHPPDLTVYLDDLALRAMDTVGAEALYTETNNTGRDAANHDWDGVFILAGAGVEAAGRVEGAQLLDVAPALESLLGVGGGL